MNETEIPVELQLQKIEKGQLLRVLWMNGGGNGRQANVTIESGNGPLGVAKSLTELASRIIEMCRVEGK